MSPELDDEGLIRSMVRVLRQHPGEWLTFRRISQLVAIPGIEEYAVGSVAEYRDDLFAISHDRKVKLRQSVLEQTAHQDITNWVVPQRLTLDERRELRDRRGGRYVLLRCSFSNDTKRDHWRNRT